jgi:predicted RNA-binding protein with PIN domain
MHYLIDGHNLIGQTAGISLADPDDEARLVALLRRWTAAGRQRKVTVIFDGGIPGGRERALSSGPVEVVFAPAGRPADDLLLARIRRVRNPAEHTLVSSDRKLVEAAAARRMGRVASAAFAAELEAPAVAPAPADPREGAPSADEVAEWLALFGGE